MKQKSKLFRILIGIFLVLGTLIFSMTFFLRPNSNKEIKMFEDEFGMSLPNETNVTFSESDYGAMGDGTRLYVYQIAAKDVENFSAQNSLGGWFKLPFNKELVKGLHEKVNGLASEKIAHAINFGSQKGYYIVKNRYNRPLAGYHFDDLSYSNIIIGIIDTEKNKIYLLTWDM